MAKLVYDLRLRAPAALAAAAIEAALAYALIAGFAPGVVTAVRQRLEVLSIPARPSPALPPAPSTLRPSAESTPAEAPAGPRARAAQVVAPPPAIVLAPPPPFVTAPFAGSGDQANAGAAEAGAGQGGGGDGADRGLGRAAQRLAGALRDSDYPAAAARERAAGTVFIRFTIASDGRVRGCEVVRSSGSALLDATTCRLVEQRFRYRPALAADGRPMESSAATDFTWGTR